MHEFLFLFLFLLFVNDGVYPIASIGRLFDKINPPLPPLSQKNSNLVLLSIIISFSLRHDDAIQEVTDQEHEII